MVQCVLFFVQGDVVSGIQRFVGRAEDTQHEGGLYIHVFLHTRTVHWLPVQQRIKYKVCVLVSIYIRLHQHTLLNCAHRCLNQPAVFTSVLQRGVTWQYHTSEQRDTVRPKMFCCFQTNLVELTPLTIRDPSLTLTQFSVCV